MHPLFNDLDDRLELLRSEAALLAQGGPLTTPDAAPRREYARTPVAARVGRAAAREGLFSFHFEHRVPLTLPEDWVPSADPELADPPPWTLGVMPERKYQSFRHDLPIGSYHPHHRAKWSTHELCHGLVGFAWSAGATPFFHATAGRLAELLPVALWYFFDEALLTRCPAHLGQGALFRPHCEACETIAAPRPDDPGALKHLADGLRYMDAELAAIARSRRLGQPLPNRYATLNLCSDGVAYALAHGDRLASHTFAAFAERFTLTDRGRVETLDALEERVLAVTDELLGGPAAPALAPTPAHGRWRWTAQDLAWRLHTIAHDTDGDASASLNELLQHLEQLVQHTDDESVTEAQLQRHAEDTFIRVRKGYDTLTEDWHLPEPEDVFALGYAGPGLSSGHEQLAEGLLSCVPLTRELLGAGFSKAVQGFAALDPLVRRPLAQRWAKHLTAHHPGPIADLATWEAALSRVPLIRPPALHSPGSGVVRAEGVQVLHLSHDVVRLAERVDAGAVDGDGCGGLQVHEGDAVISEPCHLIVGRDRDNGLLVLDLDEDTAHALTDGRADDIDGEVQAVLLQLGVLVPTGLVEHLPPPVSPLGV